MPDLTDTQLLDRLERLVAAAGYEVLSAAVEDPFLRVSATKPKLGAGRAALDSQLATLRELLKSVQGDLVAWDLSTDEIKVTVQRRRAETQLPTPTQRQP